MGIPMVASDWRIRGKGDVGEIVVFIGCIVGVGLGHSICLKKDCSNLYPSLLRKGASAFIGYAC
jgi:hypothetical protein